MVVGHIGKCHEKKLRRSRQLNCPRPGHNLKAHVSSVASSEHAGNPAQRSQAYCYRGTNCESGHAWATAQDAKRGLPTQSGNRKYFRLAVRARLRNQRAPGAQREGEGKGKIERRGTRRYEKGVCTWGWPSTAEGGWRAVDILSGAGMVVLLRAVCDGVRCTAPTVPSEGARRGPLPRPTAAARCATTGAYGAYAIAERASPTAIGPSSEARRPKFTRQEWPVSAAHQTQVDAAIATRKSPKQTCKDQSHQEARSLSERPLSNKSNQRYRPVPAGRTSTKPSLDGGNRTLLSVFPSIAATRWINQNADTLPMA